jgi:AcrR family transcriptional regulator
MRKEANEKRQQILDTAYRLFREGGFEKTSVSKITSEVGGSKATLYNYFSSKEELFVECMFDVAEHYMEDVYSSFNNPKLDLAAALQGFGENVIRLLCSQDMLSARRLMVSEAKRSGIGKLFYKKICSRLEQVTAFIDRAMDEGKLCRSDAMLAAFQLRALVEAEIFEPYFYCVLEAPPTNLTIAQASERAVATFLRAYAPNTDTPVYQLEKRYICPGSHIYSQAWRQGTVGRSVPGVR